MISVNLNDTAILNIWGVDYSCINDNISKRDAINLLQSADFTEEKKVF